MRHLVTLGQGEEEVPNRRTVPYRDFVGSEAADREQKAGAKGFVDLFIEKRLLVANTDPQGEVTVCVSRPEVQLNLVQQNNTTVNSLTITISAEEVKELETQAAPERERVKQMFAAYRQGTIDYSDGEKPRILDVQAEQVDTESTEDAATRESVRQKFAEYRPEQPVAQAPIVHKEGDEKKSVFWYQFVSGNNRRLVEKRTAFYVVREIVLESVGPRFAQSIVFESEPISVARVLRMIEKLSGPAGWQVLLKKSDYIAHLP
jgi:acyl-CoA-binding protein